MNPEKKRLGRRKLFIPTPGQKNPEGLDPKLKLSQRLT
jgi:hypothetical protein